MKTVAITWKTGGVSGTLEVRNGKLVRTRLAAGKGSAKGTSISIGTGEPGRLEVTVGEEKIGLGPDQTIVSVNSKKNAFSFLLRDVNAINPVFVAAYGVAVTDAADKRSYDQIAEDIRRLGLQDNMARFESEPEESFEKASAVTRSQMCPTWLGLSRDMRIFEVGYNFDQKYWGFVNPRYHGSILTLPETENQPVWYGFVVGRGAACVNPISRSIEDGRLPILHSTAEDDDIRYNLTAFVTLEQSSLTLKNLRGTDFLVADGYGAGHMFTEAQAKEHERLKPAELNREEETVLYTRVEAVNTAKVPRYAWFKNAYHGPRGEVEYDAKTGFKAFKATGRVFAVSTVNGKPLPQEEMAVLLQPGEKAVFEFRLPHQPIPADRAARLARQDFGKRHAECRAYWQAKLASGATVDLPEPVLDNMVAAGLLHLDVVAYGKEPTGSIAATIGVYCPIGSESSPIIQFFDSMGWHKVAERSLGYFLDKQHDDGFIQNFGGYMLETGPALWSMGEHYRYTRDESWIRRIKPKLVKACEFMLAWRDRNKKEELRGRGYGMQEGKVADPEDPFHSFMLNGYAYLGMKRVSEMLQRTAPAESRRWAREAEAFKKDIRDTFFVSMAKSPVVPLGDGTWIPSAPPWAESTGPVALYVEPGNWFTHGTFTGRDSLLGPLYMIAQEVVDPDEPAAGFLVKWNGELLCKNNVCLSQPYYCRNDIAHIRRGEVKPFLKMFYNGFSGLADRETYTWWEHYFHASPHKTHEEGWFLMQTRWMLWIEEGSTLKFLNAAPRAWLADGKQIRLTNIATYFGPASLVVNSKLREGRIEATVTCATNRRPKEVRIRLPHPEGLKAVRVEGGSYDPATETVIVRGFRGKARIVVSF